MDKYYTRRRHVGQCTLLVFLWNSLKFNNWYLIEFFIFFKRDFLLSQQSPQLYFWKCWLITTLHFRGGFSLLAYCNIQFSKHDNKDLKSSNHGLFCVINTLSSEHIKNEILFRESDQCIQVTKFKKYKTWDPKSGSIYSNCFEHLYYINFFACTI